MTALIKKTWFRAAVIALIAVMASCSVISAAFTVFLGHNGIYEGSRKDFSERILKDNALDRAYDFLNENVHYGEESDGDDNVSLSRNALNDEDYDFIVKYDSNTIAKSYEKNEKYVVSSLEAYGEYNGKELSVKAFLKDGHEAAVSMKWINRAYDFRYAVPALSISLVILVIAGIVILIKGTDLWFRKIPADLYSVVAFGVIIFTLNLSKEYVSGVVLSIIYIFCIGTFCTALFLIWMIAVIGQVKGGVLIESTVVYRFIRLLGCGFRHLPDVWKIIVPTAIAVFIAFVMISFTIYSGEALFIVFACGMLLLAAVWYLAIMVNRITAGARNIRDGNSSHVISTDKMCPVLKEHAETINEISRAVDAAVEEKMKSERLKTELITNVSHDIKTPLTSIINYTDLLTSEGVNSERAEEYLSTISANAIRLKKLTSDILEASKISTGNINVERTRCNLNMMLEQAMGEYEEKMKNAGLIPVVKYPKNEVTVLADGEYSWRIIDNIMNNICKYSQHETRVYMEIFQSDGYGCISFKNVSATELDISPEELMERFVRGDESRNTEGSGLGLSIGGDLAKAQGGELDISIDGDLFKSIIKFEAIEKPNV